MSYSSAAENLRSSLGLTLFSTPADRALAKRVDDGLERIEDGLQRELDFANVVADASAKYLLNAGGKRMRPALMLVTAQLGNGLNDEIISAAKAIELTHLASLYHDDVMDEAQLRRGVPAAHTVWGNSVAVITGDLLFARASRISAALGEEAVTVQAATFERLCLGQIHELTGPQPGEDAVEHYVRVLSDKTGSLIALAAQMGILFSGAPRELLEPVTEFAEKIGVAFQLVDDVIDLADAEEETGKKAGTDLLSGVDTMPVLLLRDQALRDAGAADLQERIDRNSAAADGEVPAEFNQEEFTRAVAELREHSVTERTLAEAERWRAEAVAALDRLPKGPVRRALVRFADMVVQRTR